MKSATVTNLKFGQVPDGLQQVFPETGVSPQLELNVRYAVNAGSGVSGAMEFTPSGECHMIALTPLAKTHPAYNVSDRSADVP